MTIPPPLKDDCLALPAGVRWAPVAEVLSALEVQRIAPLKKTLKTIDDALGAVLAADVTALRAHPPLTNSAVDGYGFNYESLTKGNEIQEFRIIFGRSAAGDPFKSIVPPRHSIRVLTGAVLPKGVDTVVMDEDVTRDGQRLFFRSGIKKEANTRKLGEDRQKGSLLLPKGHVLRAHDLGLLKICGISTVLVHEKLTVSVLSTGDELAESASDARSDQVIDANRPMLCGLLKKWGYDVVDLGKSLDDLRALEERLDHAAQVSDVIITSGGASAGDEDHMSSLLNRTQAMTLWRVAMKPGRPFGYGRWQGKSVFVLPGNPVAAFVCALIFVMPSLRRHAGGEWVSPMGFDVVADFSKAKKAGRREYLRARLREDRRVEVFGSEGSGLISGLSWADGLVELPDEACEIAPGDLVRFIPYQSFGI